MFWNIVSERGYYAVYANGELMFTADTKGEAMEEMEQWENGLIA